MLNNIDLLKLFESYLAQIKFPSEPVRLYSPFFYSLSGEGKRVRPLLLLLVANLFGDNTVKALPAAAAVEVFHNFTLLHDDIMDNADVRRGKPSVKAKWGENVAILSGDAMLISAYRMLEMLPREIQPELLKTFNETSLAVCEGQQYDMDYEERQVVTVIDYMHMIELKTSVLLRGAATMGAIIGGAPAEDYEKLQRFATELGLAFQLQDDLLDSYGDESFGKKLGGDILEGKQSYLMVSAMSKATEPQREILRKTHLDDSLTDEQKIAKVKALYEELDIPRTAEQQISIKFERALSMLERLSVDKSKTLQLAEFARSLMGRQQ